MASSSYKPTARSQGWLGKYGTGRTVSRAFLMGEGFTNEDMDGRPIIGICNSWSELNNCNVHLNDVAAAVKRGVW